MSCGDTVIRHVLVGRQLFDIPWSERSFRTCPCSGHSLTTCHGWDTGFRHALLGTQFPTCRGRNAAFYVLWGHSYSTCPGWEAVKRYACSGHSLTTCHGWDTVLHVVVEMQYYMSCGDTVLQHVLVRTQFYDIAWSGRSYTTCPGRGAVLQYAMFGKQFNNMLWSGHSFTTCHGWNTVLRALLGTQFRHVVVGTQLSMSCGDTVIRHVLVGRQLFDIPWTGHSFMTCPDCDVVLRHVLVRMQFYDISGSGRSYSTCPG